MTPRPSGMTLLPVLFIIALITIVVVMFFGLSTVQYQSSTQQAAAQDVGSLRDMAVNLAIGQLRQGTTENNAVWISQPGAVRTYASNSGAPSRIYKLYSAGEMVTSAAGLTAAALNLETDVPPSWQSLPEVYADLNEPAIRDTGELAFPVLDPRAMAGNAAVPPSGDATPEGFRYTANLAVGGSSVDGVHLPGTFPEDQRLPMPVRWIYQLANGTYGVLDPATKQFVPFLDQGSGTTPSVDNPIIGRIAFWTDDETSKVNVNTASEGIHWDTPRAATPEDVAYATQTPVRNEVQRFGGHPASTSLSSVFFPRERLTPGVGQGNARLQQIYDMVPRVNFRSGTGVGASATGILGGGASPVAFDKDRLYASIDEFLLQAPGSSPPAQRSMQPLLAADPDRLARLRFFLTAESRAPETTAAGTPRISLWPTSWDPDTTSSRYTSFDRLGMFAATLGGKPYYYRRYLNPNSALTEYGSSNSTGANLENLRGNADLSRYLVALSALTKQGYAGSLKDKYGQANMATGLISMLEYIRQTNIHDTTLSTTGTKVQPYDQGVWGSTSFPGTETHGQIINVAYTALPKPMVDQLNEDPLVRANALNRIYTLSEFGLVLSLAAENPSSGTKYNETLCNLLKLPAGYKAIQIGTAFEGFCPSQGYSMIAPSAGIRVVGLDTLRLVTSESGSAGRVAGGDVTGPQPAYTQTSFNTWGRWNHSVPHLCYLTGMAMPGAMAKVSKGADWWIGWGGSGGRSLYVDAPTKAGIGTTSGYGTNVTSIGEANFYLPQFGETVSNQTQASFYSRGYFLVPSADTQVTVKSATALQLYSGYVNYGPSHALIRHYITIPTGMVVPVPKAPVALLPTWRERIVAASANRARAPEVIDRGDVVRTWTVRHGDYRLVSMRENEKSHNETHKLFLPHPDWNPGEAGGEAQSKLQIHSFTKAGGEWERQQQGDPRSPNSAVAQPVDARPARGLAAGVTYAEKTQPDFTRLPTSSFYFPGKPANYPYSLDPSDTRDWDNGTGIAPDGAYWNKPDDVAKIADGTIPPYFSARPWDGVRPEELNQTSAPNQLIPSAVMFGSISSGVVTGLPWTTYLFRPNLSPTGHVGEKGQSVAGSDPNAPPDHTVLDWFWMPVLQPYAISEPFSTAGKINMNYRIVPFTNIRRATGLHAVLKSERLLAIPNDAGATYKDYASASVNTGWRHYLDVDKTLLQWDLKFNSGGFFKHASEICEQFLVPEGQGISATSTNALRVEMTQYWDNHRLTGDNTLERPYANLYPRLTTRSNTFRVHYHVQSLRKARTSDPLTFDPAKDVVTGAAQGDALVERAVDPNDPALSTSPYDYMAKLNAGTFATDLDSGALKSLDTLYTWRIRQVRNFAK